MKYNIIGQKFGKLLVTENIGIIKGKTKFKTLCDCGNINYVWGSSLIRPNGTKSCGCLKKNYFNNLEGFKCNKITIGKCLGKNKYNSFIYTLTCNCGTIFTGEGNDVKTERLKSCGCLKTEKNIEKCNKDPYHALEYNLFSDYRKKASYRNISFELDYDYFRLLTKNNCNYCGSKPSNIKTRHRNNKIASNVILYYNGIDRVDNTKGYTKENSVSCCKICNQAKHTMSLIDFLNWINRVYNHVKKTAAKKEDW